MIKGNNRLLLAVILILLSLTIINYLNGHNKDRTVDQLTDNEATEDVTIHMFTNLPDRTTGQGLLEQQLIDAYLSENSGIHIEVEALHDEAYKRKFVAYTASNNLPDVMSVWGQSAFIDPVINSAYLAELNLSDYDNYDFIEGSMNGFRKNGKLYGLPRNTDIWVVYYNKDIFNKYSLSVPTTMKALYKISDKLDAAGVNPCSIAGKDKWTLACLYTDLLMKITGDNTLIQDAIQLKNFSHPAFKRAAEEMTKLIENDFFQKDFLNVDYGGSKNDFLQGKSAMLLMGSWEMSMSKDVSIDPSVKNQIGVFSLPRDTNSLAKRTDITAWNGGGYAIAANSPVREEAIKFLNYMLLPENWAKKAWQSEACIPAQTFEGFQTGNETEIQLTLIELLSNATNISGTPIHDMSTPRFKVACEDLCQQLAAGIINDEEFIQMLGEILE